MQKLLNALGHLCFIMDTSDTKICSYRSQNSISYISIRDPLFYVNFTIFFFHSQPIIVCFCKYCFLLQIAVSCFGIFAQSFNSLSLQKISFPVHTRNARSAPLSKGLRAFCIHVFNLFYQFRLNSASSSPGFFCSAQRMLHSLLNSSRFLPWKSCTHLVSDARLSALGSSTLLVIQRMKE